WLHDADIRLPCTSHAPRGTPPAQRRHLTARAIRSRGRFLGQCRGEHASGQPHPPKPPRHGARGPIGNDGRAADLRCLERRAPRACDDISGGGRSAGGGRRTARGAWQIPLRGRGDLPRPRRHLRRLPALLGYALGNEVPAQIVRWLGPRRIERYLERLYRIVKAEDPDGLVTYVNYPTTEYLRLQFLDLVCFNVYLESRDRFEAYLARLHNLAGAGPLV